jgi:hypothetical protein
MGAFYGLMGKASQFAGAFDKQMQSEMLLATTIANTGGTYEDFEKMTALSKSMGEKTTIGDEVFNAGLAEIRTYISDAEALTELVPSMADFAIGMNQGGASVGYEQMTSYMAALGKALQGQYDGLSKKGFKVSDAQKEILQNGTDMEKVNVIAGITKEIWGGLAENVAKTPTGKVQQFQNDIGDLYEIIGGRLYPAIAGFYDLFKQNEATVAVVVKGVGDGFIFIIGAARGAAETALWLFNLFIEYEAPVKGALTLIAGGFLLIKYHALATAASAIFCMGTATGMTVLFGGAINSVSAAFTFLKYVIMAHPLGFFLTVVAGLVVYLISRFGDLATGVEYLGTCASDVFADIKFGVMACIEQAKLLFYVLTGNKKAVAAQEDAIRVLRDERANTHYTNEEARRVIQAKIDAVQKQELTMPDNSDLLRDIMGNTAKMAQTVDSGRAIKTKNTEPLITDEDLRLLTDIATREYQLQYKQITPRINIRTGDIRETADAGKVLEILADAVESVAASRLEVAAQ